MAQTGDEAGSVLENLPGITDFHQLQFYERLTDTAAAESQIALF